MAKKAKLTDVRGKKPRCSPDEARKVKEAARKLSERLLCGDLDEAGAAYPPATGTVSRGLTPQQEGDGFCSHYLKDDRFSWWDAWTNSIPATGEGTDVFLCEFHPALATVMGANLDRLRDLGYRTLPWDDQSTHSLPQDVPGTELSVRYRRPFSNPRLQTLPRDISKPSESTSSVGVRASTGQNRKVLVHLGSADPNIEPNDQDLREPIWIDFDRPQRAVGIEYGYLERESSDVEPRTAGITLRAYTVDGDLVATSPGDLINKDESLDRRRIDHKIAVKDRLGRIRSVKLSFGRDPSEPDKPAEQPQVIYRIWHEPLPPAVLKQGKLSEDRDIEIPFNCDRALVLMRGFQIRATDGKPHELRDIGVRISGPGFREITPDPNGARNIRMGPRFRLRAAGGTPPFQGHVYYSILAWRSDEIELFQRSVDTQRATNPLPMSNARSPFRMIPEPCRRPPPHSESNCGPLLGVMHGFEFRHVDTDDLDLLAIALGGADQPTFASEDIYEVPPDPDMARTGFQGRPHVGWKMLASMEIDGVRHRSWQVVGHLLAGRSLSIGSVPGGVPTSGFPEFQPGGRRANESSLLLDPDTLDAIGWSWNVEGDMPIFGIGHMHLEPEDEVRELDVEVVGASYDGQKLKWGMAGGISTVDESDDDNECLVLGAPVFGSVRRKSFFQNRQLSVQDLEIVNAPVGASYYAVPRRWGVIRNTGEVPVYIGSLKIEGPQASEFDILCHTPWRDIPLVDFTFDLLPFRLTPGRSILISAAVTATQAAPPGSSGREAWLTIRAANAQAPVLRLPLRAFTT